MRRIGQDYRRRDNSREHTESMLESKEGREKYWHLIVQSEEGSRSSIPLHEWEVWFEEESIIIVSNKSIFGGEGSHGSTSFVPEAALGGVVGTNAIGFRHGEEKKTVKCFAFTFAQGLVEPAWVFLIVHARSFQFGCYVAGDH